MQVVKKILEAELPQEEQFPFAEDFQDTILKVMMSDSDYANLLTQAVAPEYFDGKERMVVCATCRELQAKYKTPPKLSAVENSIRASRMSKSDLSLTLALLRRIAALESRRLDEHVVDETLSFCQRKAVVNVLLDSADLVEQGQYSELRNSLDAAILATTKATLQPSYFDTYASRLKAGLPEREQSVLTFITKLDEVMHGLRRKELFAWLAPPGRGKSHALVCVGKAALIQGMNVLHVTLEMSKTILEMRYDAAFSGVPINDVYREHRTVTGKIAGIQKSTRGQLYIVEYPTHGLAVDGLRALYETYHSRGIRLDMIVVDYADLLVSSSRYSERRHEISSVYEALRGIAVEYDLVMVTASQTNRSSLAKKIVSMEDISEDLGKAMIADVLVSICQTPLEHDDKVIRLWVCKNRRDRDSFMVKIHCDYERGLFYDPEYDVESLSNEEVEDDIESDVD